MICSNKKIATFLIGFLVLLTSSFVVGCNNSESLTEEPSPKEMERFSARAESADGSIVYWGGKTGGYEPGTEAEFELTIKNETEQNWHGRYCLHLMAGQSHKVVATLEQREFTLESGMGFSDVIKIQLPGNLDAGAYGLSMAVRRPAGPMVDLVPIQIGKTDEIRQGTTQQDMHASLAACPPVGGIDTLVEQAKTHLAQRLAIDTDQIDVKGVEPTEFPDASLGVPEPGKSYAQVITPGYIINLIVSGRVFRYHASEERIIAVSDEDNAAFTNQISINGVTASDEQITIRGKSSLPDGTCVRSELWADGDLLGWWPDDACATVKEGAWELSVALARGNLQAGVEYVVHAYEPGASKSAAAFPFDLGEPPG